MSEVGQCHHHPDGQFDEDCEYCVAEVEAMNKQYTAVVRGNMQIERELAPKGAGIPAPLKLAWKIDQMLQGLLPNPKLRLRFEQAHAEHIRGELITLRENVAKQALTEGIIGPDGMPIDVKKRF